MYAIAELQSVGLLPHHSWQDERDNEWLNFELDYIWDTYFSDITRVNSVKIEFARNWKARVGMITLSASGSMTYIGINSLLRYRQVPWFVPTITIAHELVHYAHGFGSPLPRKYSHPHKGGIVFKELAARGLEKEHNLYTNWLADYWHSFYSRMTSELTLVPDLSASV